MWNADQPGLPEDRGLVLPDSAAAKAGSRKHDFLLELDGKPVSNEIRDLRRSLAKIEANMPVHAVVMRQGKQEHLKGLKLPEAKAPASPLGARLAFPDFLRRG